jgi:hypothetical protein
MTPQAEVKNMLSRVTFPQQLESRISNPPHDAAKGAKDHQISAVIDRA